MILKYTFDKNGLRPINGTNKEGGCNFYTTLQSNDVNIREAGQGLYAWTTKAAFESAKAGGRPEIKFGQYGSNGAAKLPQDTIASYWLKSPQGPSSVPVLLFVQKITDKQMQDWVDVNAPGKEAKAIYLEKKLQNKYTTLGLKSDDGNGTEWFHQDLDTIIKDVNEELFGVRALHTYDPRPAQRACIDQMGKARLAKEPTFLMACVMRFGKNFTYLMAAKESDAALGITGGNHLVLTARPKVFSGLKQDIANHIAFDGWEYIEIKDEKDKANLKLDPNKTSIVACSSQITSNEVSGEAVTNFLKDQVWSTSFFDECHAGTDTDNFNKLVESLDIGQKVYASGTPFKIEVTATWTDKNRFTYNYIEQQRDKKDGVITDAVTLIQKVTAIDEKFVNNDLFQVDERFSLNKFFQVKSNKFVYSGEVTEFVKDILGKNLKQRNFTPAKCIEDGDSIDHTVWLLNGVKECEQLKKVINQVASDYEVVLACDKHVTDIAKVHQAVNKYDKTITLTCGRFIEGTTVKPWKAAFVLCDTSSPERYWQFNFRPASPDKGKDIAYIFDFSPQRCMEMRFELINAEARKEDNVEVSDKIVEYLQCMPIHTYFEDIADPTFKEVSVEDLLESIRTADYTSATIMKGANQYLSGIEVTEELCEKFNAAKALNYISKEIGVVDNDYTGAKSKRIIREQTEEEREKAKNALEELRAKIVGVITALPYFAEIYECKTVESVLDKVPADAFYETTKVKREAVRGLINAKHLDTTWLNFRL